MTADGFVRVAALSELELDAPKRVVVADVAVSLVRTEGEVFAINDICSHSIECWLHGSSFDLRTGKPNGLPATRPVPVYPVKIEGDDVLVSVTQES